MRTRMARSIRGGGLPAAVLATAVVLASCAGFQGTRQVPALLAIDQAANRDAGPWLTPVFGQGSDGTASMIVSWITLRPIGTRLAWGEEGALSRAHEDEERTKLHRVTLSELSPGVRYQYAADFDGNGCEDDPRHCFTATDWSRDGLTILVLGDMQPRDAFTRRGGRIAAQAVAASGADLVIQLGDLAEIGAFASDWLDALDALSLFASRIPTVGIIGNHDYYGDPGRNFRALFPYPYADPKGAYWSFDAGGSHFALVDCFEKDGSVSAAQKAWLEEDLRRAGADRNTRHLFVFEHLTPITTGTSEPAGELERWLLPLADRRGVDAVFFGHDHHYEHWELVYGNEGLVFEPQDSPTGRRVHYFCSGGGGAYLEIDYGLLTRKPTSFSRRLWDRARGEWVERSYFRLPWDSGRYIDHTDEPEFGQLLDGRHYYHLPEEASYQGDTEWLGYQYGEQTLHYLLMRLRPEGAQISAHYLSGEILAGPRGDMPQAFTIPLRPPPR
ncbi:MAG: metallophosphoesterase family protein [Spirochaetales bacterium]|nr:metallophosphoesterase family protein [Spirochaetales bacterium]